MGQLLTVLLSKFAYHEFNFAAFGQDMSSNAGGPKVDDEGFVIPQPGQVRRLCTFSQSMPGTQKRPMKLHDDPDGAFWRLSVRSIDLCKLHRLGRADACCCRDCSDLLLR